MPVNRAIGRAKYMYIRDRIFQVKYNDWLIIRLKAIKSKKDIYCYLSSYLYYSLI